MNTYTLSFIDNTFEIKFQNHIYKSYSTMYYLLTVGIICGLVLIIIQNIFTDHRITNLSIIQIIAIVYLICQIFFIRKFQKWTLLAIITNNTIVMISSIDMHEKNSNLTYFIGQNIMCFHSIILLILDFKIAAFNNIIILIWRVLILTMKVKGLYFADISTAILTHVVLMACLYIKCKAQRELFLLYMKDQKWETLIPEIVSKPMFIFTFDKKNLKFQSKLAVPMEFLKDIENPLQYFMRNTYYLGKTLEQYIFRKFKSYESSKSVEETEILRVKYLKESKIVKLTTFKLNIVTMIITIEDEDLNIYILKKEQEKYQEDLKRTMKQSILNQIRVMRNLLQTRNKNQLQNILIQYSQLILIQQLDINEVQKVELSKLLTRIIREFRMKRIKLITYQPIYIQTQKSKMQILLMQITKQLLKLDKLILIQLYQVQESVVITIKQVEPIQIKFKSQIIQKIFNELIEQITQVNQQITIKFYQQPQISFK